MSSPAVLSSFRRSQGTGSKARRIGLFAQSSSSPPSSLGASAAVKDEGGAHSLPAYIHPPIPVEATATHSHSHPHQDKQKAPPEMSSNHLAVLFLLYVAASLALAALLPSSAAASLLATVWLSFVLAISFTEAWVKFKAPTLSKPSALDAGRQVFRALNAVESGVAVALACALYLRPRPAFPFAPPALGAWRRLAAVPLAALVLDVSWLTPALDRRARELIVGSWKKGRRGGQGGGEDKTEQQARAAVAEMESHDKGTPVPPAWFHGVYVMLEAVKVVSLALLVKSAGRGAFV